MTLTQLLIILCARTNIILATLLVMVALTIAVSLVIPQTYKTSATLLLNDKGTDPIPGRTLPAQLVAGYMATQFDIVTSKKRAAGDGVSSCLAWQRGCRLVCLRAQANPIAGVCAAL
ncbi:Wzz/FepE/Etk N-terminal domain-containing protein [Glaciimonas sp. GG7]